MYYNYNKMGNKKSFRRIYIRNIFMKKTIKRLRLLKITHDIFMVFSAQLHFQKIDLEKDFNS